MIFSLFRHALSLPGNLSRQLGIHLFFMCETARRRLIQGLLLVITSTACRQVYAADIADILDSLAKGATSGQKSTVIICMFLGVLSVAGGFGMLYKKKTNPNIPTGGVWIAFLVGIALIGLGEIIRRGQSQLGMTEVSI
ncbi:hypothetical protein E0V76_18960 [Salmonella enterica subsp. enterica serovar Saintpaul]|uniref:Uncharacterized protein n=1 Tax=Salmonella enterica subsp. enterica serovar Saintpaul TaxID=90105 RepID=A0A5W5JXC9_SALET|nr:MULTISPECIES: DUF6750 family protein [Enterobacteriaceae]EBX1945289.1 hypothetical protein [Salmonella enterica subsp. enterica serovar Saintpaul]ECF3086853.1 hypothetical protein [Salmonella enterica subsp. enterica serovar Bareilly]EAS8622561.1 hypothetical protein [Salmonella enterica]EAW5281225.1 hypothetical protein [Salmonella enterica]EAY1495809.1 hypothetical protein [Salmonella enterica]